MKRSTMAPLLLTTVLSFTVTGGAVQAGPSDFGRAPQCHGERATVVGKPGGVIRGTGRSDVIVTNGAKETDAVGGDDVICVTGHYPGQGTLYVSDGDGDDVVDATRSQDPMYVALGDGDNRVLGSAHADVIVLYGGGRDVVRLGPGDDRVTVLPRSAPGLDTISLGRGDDTVWIFGSKTPSLLVGGKGRDELDFDGANSPMAWRINNRTETAKGDGVVRARWRHFEVFELSLETLSVRFDGTSASEKIVVHDTAIDVTLGGGNDELKVDANVSGIAHGGPGEDLFGIQQGVDITADLATGSVVFTRYTGDVGGLTAPGFDDVRASFFATAHLIGTDTDNRIQGYRNCHTVMDGAGGNDSMLMRDAARGCDGADSETPSGGVAMNGGPGNDSMIGAQGNDQLRGNQGRDTADGGDGTDTCTAETEVNCELD